MDTSTATETTIDLTTISVKEKIDPRIPSPAERLPYEVWSKIFKLLCKSSTKSIEFSLETPLVDNFKSTELLLPLTKINRLFNVAVEDLLYQNVCIERNGQIATLVEDNPSRLQLVKHLRVIWNRQPWIVPDPDLTSLPKLIELCPNLIYLTLGGEQFDLRNLELQASIVKSNIRGINCCTLDSSFLDQRFGPQDRRTSGVISQILEGCNLLESVRFDEFRSSYDDRKKLGSTGEGKKAIFKQLVLKKCGLEKEMLESLLQSAMNLEELYLDRTSLSTTTAWRKLVEGFGTLKVLHLIECEFWATWEAAESVTLVDHLLIHCPNLLELTLRGSLDSGSPSFEGGHKKLKKISISGNRFLTVTVVAEAMLENKFPALKELIIKDSGWTEEMYLVMKESCELVSAQFLRE